MGRLNKCLEVGNDLTLELSQMCGHIQVNWEWYAPIAVESVVEITYDEARYRYPTMKYKEHGSCTLVDSVGPKGRSVRCRYVAVENDVQPKLILRLKYTCKLITLKGRSHE